MDDGRRISRPIAATLLTLAVLTSFWLAASAQEGQPALDPPQSGGPPPEIPPMSQAEANATGEDWASALIGDVRDCNWFRRHGCKSGCTPTAAGDIISYWDMQGYPELIEGKWDDAVWKLHKLMRTDCEGWTSPRKVPRAIERFALRRGYSGFDVQWKKKVDTRWGVYKREISSGRPVLITWGYSGFKPEGCTDSWSLHTVAGVGYRVDDDGKKFLTVLDGWQCSDGYTAFPWNAYIHLLTASFFTVDSPSEEVRVVMQAAYTTDGSGNNKKTQFQRGDYIRLVIVAKNAGTRTITTTWEWETMNPSGDWVAGLSWDNWTVVLEPGEKEYWWLTRQLSSDLPLGTYTFTGAVRHEALTLQKHIYFTLQ